MSEDNKKKHIKVSSKGTPHHISNLFVDRGSIVSINNSGNTVEESVSNDNKQAKTKKWDYIFKIILAVIPVVLKFGFDMISDAIDSPPVDPGVTTTAESTPSHVPDDKKLTFSIDKDAASHSGIDYVVYTVSSNPEMFYQVMPYPYLRVTYQDTTHYIPLCGIYSQEQYASDKSGFCTIEREDIYTELEDYCIEYLNISGEQVEVGTLLAIQYVDTDDKLTTNVYTLRDGVLTLPYEHVSYDILRLSDDPDSFKLKLQGWPSNKEYIGGLLTDYFDK